MNKTVILIGGGNLTKEKYNLDKLDLKIVEITKKESPNLLFIGLGSKYADSTYDILKNKYQKLGCKTKQLKKKNCINNPNIVKEKIETADIIYIGGGDTIELMNCIKEYNIEKYLKAAYQKGTILVGYSAGTILLSKEGFSDAKILRKESTEYEFIKGISIINKVISPHYDKNSEKTKQLKMKIEDKTVLGITDNCALIIQNNKINKFTWEKKANAYEIKKEDNYSEIEI